MIRQLGILLMSACCVAGCDFTFGSSTEGDRGELEFGYAGDALFECLFGCEADAPILVGATATVVVDDDLPDESFTVHVPSWVSHDYEEIFECELTLADGSTTSRTVEHGEPCRPEEHRSAVRLISLRATEEGIFPVEVLLDGEILDSIDIEAREHDSFAVRDAETGLVADRVALSLGGRETLDPVFYDAEGRELYYDDIDGYWSADDEELVTVDNDADWGLGGSAEVEVIARAAGSTVLRFAGPDGEWAAVPVVVH